MMILCEKHGAQPAPNGVCALCPTAKLTPLQPGEVVRFIFCPQCKTGYDPTAFSDGAEVCNGCHRTSAARAERDAAPPQNHQSEDHAGKSES